MKKILLALFFILFVAQAYAQSTLYSDPTTGRVGIGSTAPISSLDLTQRNDALALPIGTSGARPTGTALSNGEMRYNTTLSSLEAYIAGSWTSLASSNGSRMFLTATTNFYVSTTGSDSNNGSVSAPWLTIGHALSYVQQNYDLGGQTVNINVADGTYTTPIALVGPFVGGVPNLIGDVSTPANCIISTPSSNGLSLTNGANLNIEGFKITATSANALYVSGAVLNIIGAMNYGAANTHFEIYNGAQVYVNASYTISGAAPDQHIYANNANVYLAPGITVTFSGNPAVGVYYIAKNAGYVLATSITYSGTSSNVSYKYQILSNGLLETGGASSLPGSLTYTASQGQVL